MASQENTWHLNSHCSVKAQIFPIKSPQFQVYWVDNSQCMASLVLFSSVQSLSHVRLFATSWTAAARLPCPSPTPRACSNSCPSSRWYHPTISFSIVPFSSCLQSFSTSGSSLMNQFFASVGPSIGTSASASPFCPRNSQESSPTSQFKSINSSALSFLHSPTFTSIHDHRKNHSLD